MIYNWTELMDLFVGDFVSFNAGITSRRKAFKDPKSVQTLNRFLHWEMFCEFQWLFNQGRVLQKFINNPNNSDKLIFTFQTN